MKRIICILVASLLVATTYAASGYPVDGAWALVGNGSAPEEARKTRAACDAYRKLGVQKLKGILVHELVVFAGNKRIDFGGYADSESTNLSVAASPNGAFKIVDRYFHDGEDGGRPAHGRRHIC